MTNVPEGWALVRLSDVVEMNPPQPERDVSDDELVSFVPMAAVEERTGRLDASATRPWRDIKRGYKRFQEGDVLFAKITPCMENGKVALAERLSGGAGAGSTEFHVLRPSLEVLPRYLLHFFLRESLRRDARRVMQGAAGQLRVPESFLRSLSIPVPPRPEQDRIVSEIDSHLTRVDAAEAACRRTRVNLTRYRASLLKAACEGRLVPTEAELARNEGRDYEPADLLLERIQTERRVQWEEQALEDVRAKGEEPKDDRWKGKYKEPVAPNNSQARALPEGWTWATVEQLNQARRPVAYGVLQPGPHMEGGVPLVRVGDVGEGRVGVEGLKRVRPEIAARYPRTQLQGGEVLLTLVGTIGRTAVVPAELAGANTARAVGVIPLTPLVRPRWVELWFRNPAQIASLTAAAHEVARKTLNLEDVRSAPVALPPLAEQDRILSEVEAALSIVDDVVVKVDQAEHRAYRLRQSILKRAFEGRLVVHNASDKPAGGALERIRATVEEVSAGRLHVE